MGPHRTPGSAIRERKSGAGASRRIVSVSPLAITPGDVAGLPGHVRARADDIGQVACAHGLCIPGFSVRSIVSLNVCAVTGWFEGGEKRKPGRILNV